MLQAAPSGPVSLSEAARLVGVHKSTLSRDLAKGLFPNLGSDGAPLVDVAQVIAGRSRGIDIAMRRQAPAVDQLLDVEAPARFQGVSDHTLAAERIRKTRAEADRAEIDNAERQGDLVPRREVEAAGLDIGAELRRILETRVYTLAQRVLAAGEQKAVMKVLEDDVREVLNALADQLLRADVTRTDDDGRVAA